MKTVHITNYYHKNSGGISTVYNHFLEYANAHQRHIALIVPGEEDTVEQIGDYAKIYYVAAMKSPLFDTRYRIIMPWQFMVKDSRVREILLEEKPDLIEVCDKYLLSLLAAMIRKNAFKKLGRPMLVQLSCERMDDNISAFLSKGKFGKWFASRMMGNYNAPLYDFYIAVSSYVAAEYEKAVSPEENPSRSKAFFNWCWRFFRGAKVPLNERVYTCLRGGTNPAFSTDNYSQKFQKEIREELGIPQNSRILFYAGRISPEKNIELLIKTMEVLRKDSTQDYRLLVAGDGPKADWLQAEFEKCVPDALRMLGHITDKQKLANLYANCDVFVHPNPHEPYGIGPLEAMISGAPVVAPNSGGILSYATQENAWLVEPTGENFAQAINEILTDKSKTKEKIAKAIETAKEITWEKSSAEVFAIYEQIYQKFQSENESFTYLEKPKNFDFAKQIGK